MRFPVVRLFTALAGLIIADVVSAAPKKIIILAGAPSHGPLQHEHRAAALLFQKCLAGVPEVVTEVHDHGWPSELRDGQRVDRSAALDDAAAIVIYADGGDAHPALQPDRLAVLTRLTRRGVGLGLIHYATEPAPDRGQREFLDWVGGVFEPHWSVNPLWKPRFTALPDHPVTRGVQPFASADEWYFHLRFREGLRGITPILTAVAPRSTLKRRDGSHSGNPAVRRSVAAREPQTLMWVSERPEGGRGFGFTGGHYHLTWKNDDQRKLVLNAMLWLAGVDVPADGVSSTVTDADLMANLDPKPGDPADFAEPPVVDAESESD